MVSTVYISIIARLVSDVNNKKPKRPRPHRDRWCGKTLSVSVSVRIS